MKASEIEPGKFYAIGKDNGGPYADLEKTFVVSVGRWEKNSQWNRKAGFSERPGSRPVVGIAVPGYYGNYNNTSWEPDTRQISQVRFLWEDWEKEKGRRLEEQRAQAQEKELRAAQDYEQIEVADKRLRSVLDIPLSVYKSSYSPYFSRRNNGNVDVRLTFQELEKLLTLAENGKELSTPG